MNVFKVYLLRGQKVMVCFPVMKLFIPTSFVSANKTLTIGVSLLGIYVYEPPCVAVSIFIFIIENNKNNVAIQLCNDNIWDKMCAKITLLTAFKILPKSLSHVFVDHFWLSGCQPVLLLY